MRSVLCWLFLTSIVVGQDAVAVITGPTEANVGDLIILSSKGSEGDGFIWKLVNSNKTFLAFDDGENCVFASGDRGEFIFVLAVSKSADVGTTVDLAVQKIVVGGGNPNPGPGPNPNPNPDPDNPVPPSPVNPEPNLSGVSKEAFEAMKLVSADSAEINKVINNLRSVSSKAAGLSWNATQINKEFSSLNRSTVFTTDEAKTRWEPWAQCFIACLSREVEDDSQTQAAIRIFNELADGMEAFVVWKSKTTVSSRSTKGNNLLDSIKEISGRAHNLESKIESIRREIGS